MAAHKCKRRLLLTGTPIQNNLQELWSLLNFIHPKEFESQSKFLEQFGEMKTIEQHERLYNVLKPYVLRRMKTDVEKSLPPKEEVIITVHLTQCQKKYYKAMYEKNLSHIVKNKRQALSKNSLLNIYMQLRKVCCHPYLLTGVEEEEAKGCRTKDEIMKRLVESSGKFVLLDKLLPKLKSEGHRVLIFSQMTSLLDILEDYLNDKKYLFERLDGSTSAVDRQSAMDRFNAPNSDSFCFLLSTRAGGLGITLTTADTVIIFDSDFNLQNDIQAQARCHRIGQTKSVMVYRLLTHGTYEMEMFHRGCLKLTLDKTVLHSITNCKDDSAINSHQGTFDKNEIERMLKCGAYNVFIEEAEMEKRSKEFCEEDIDQILKRSKIIKYSENATESAFSKATFIPSTTGSAPAVQLDDPDFWNKIGIKGEAEDLLVVNTKRNRTTTQLFGGLKRLKSDDIGQDSDDDSDYEEEEEERSKKRRRKKGNKEEGKEEKKEVGPLQISSNVISPTNANPVMAYPVMANVTSIPSHHLPYSNVNSNGGNYQNYNLTSVPLGNIPPHLASPVYHHHQVMGSHQTYINMMNMNMHMNMNMNLTLGNNNNNNNNNMSNNENNDNKSVPNNEKRRTKVSKSADTKRIRKKKPTSDDAATANNATLHHPSRELGEGQLKHLQLLAKWNIHHIHGFLHLLRLGHLTPIFIAHSVTGAKLMELTDRKLQDLGVSNLEERSTILNGVKALMEYRPPQIIPGPSSNEKNNQQMPSMSTPSTSAHFSTSPSSKPLSSHSQSPNTGMHSPTHSRLQSTSSQSQPQPQSQQPVPTGVTYGIYREFKDPLGRLFYYNPRTQVSQWHKPVVEDLTNN